MLETADLATSRLWAVTLPYLRAIAAGDLVASSDVWAARGAAKQAGDVTIVPVMGLLTQRGGWFGTSVERTRATFRDAMADGSRAVVLQIDSPGGEVYGIEELGAEIRAARGGKPIVAAADSLAASAAYWIASQADEVFVTPSGEIGSIGILGAHEDWSVALDQMGIKVTLVSAGEGKVEGSPLGPLSDEALEDMTLDIERYYGMFVGAVKRGRSANGRSVGVETIRSEWGAWVYGAEEAVSIGMADHVGTIEDAVKRATQMGRERAGKAAALDSGARKRARARG
jgi:signal peptide peptidase SppA